MDWITRVNSMPLSNRQEFIMARDSAGEYSEECFILGFQEALLWFTPLLFGLESCGIWIIITSTLSLESVALTIQHRSSIPSLVVLRHKYVLLKADCYTSSLPIFWLYIVLGMCDVAGWRSARGKKGGSSVAAKLAFTINYDKLSLQDFASDTSETTFETIHLVKAFLRTP